MRMAAHIPRAVDLLVIFWPRVAHQSLSLPRSVVPVTHENSVGPEANCSYELATYRHAVDPAHLEQYWE